MLALLGIFIIYSSPLEEIAHADALWLAEDKKEAPKSATLELKEGETIVVKDFEFVGNKQIPTAQLKSLGKFLLNRPLTQNDLNEFQKRIKLFYKTKGYTATEVIIPTKQQLKQGILQIEIKENKNIPKQNEE